MPNHLRPYERCGQASRVRDARNLPELSPQLAEPAVKPSQLRRTVAVVEPGCSSRCCNVAFLSSMASCGPGVAEIVDQDVAPTPRVATFSRPMAASPPTARRPRSSQAVAQELQRVVAYPAGSHAGDDRHAVGAINRGPKRASPVSFGHRANCRRRVDCRLGRSAWPDGSVAADAGQVLVRRSDHVAERDTGDDDVQLLELIEH